MPGENHALSEVRASAIAPALGLLPAQMTSPEAVVMLLAIGLQESRFQHRRQLVGSPPRLKCRYCCRKAGVRGWCSSNASTQGRAY